MSVACSSAVELEFLWPLWRVRVVLSGSMRMWGFYLDGMTVLVVILGCLLVRMLLIAKARGVGLRVRAAPVRGLRLTMSICRLCLYVVFVSLRARASPFILFPSERIVSIATACELGMWMASVEWSWFLRW